VLSDVANILLFLAALISLYAIVCHLIGLRKKRPDFLLSGFRGLLAVCSLISISAIILFVLLITKDFSNSYVASYTNRDLPLPYAISAFWAGQDGSLLFWLWSLSVIAVIVTATRKKDELTSYASIILLLVQLFLIVVVLSLGNPFRRLPVAPPDGSGLNPLLRNIYMISHPPFIFLAYAGFTVPFAFAIGALIRRDTHHGWIARSRLWLLISWLFLGIGIILGAKWAYIVLGWGGYWAWDPVENAALIPWLVATPLLHSAIMEERKGMFRLWNKFLVLLVFELCVFGTFITRSGILSSVHAFAESNIGIYFLLFIILSSFLYLLLLFIRLPEQKGSRGLHSLFSKEGFFLLNNLIFIAGASIVLFGTIFPIISGIFSRKVTLGSSFFNQALAPLAVALLALTGLCALFPWKKVTGKRLLGKLLISVSIAFLLLLTLIMVGIRNPWLLATFSLASFTVVSIAFEFSKKHNPLRNRRRLGASIAHLGIAFISIGIIGSNMLKQETKVMLSKGESTAIGPFSIRYQDIREEETGNVYTLSAVLEIERNGKAAGTLAPSKIFYPNIEEPYSEIAVRSSAVEDLYVIFAAITREEFISVHIYRNPLIFWLWLGSILFFLGTIVAMGQKVERNKPSRQDTAIERLIQEERQRQKQKHDTETRGEQREQ
jgi:cytochrome c-type biogenesis protein CcmF